MKIAVAATAPFGAAVLEGIVNRGYDVEFLLTRPDARRVQYRVYAELDGRVYTDGVLHECLLKPDSASG